jgi:hypothetical protein
MQIKKHLVDMLSRISANSALSRATVSTATNPNRRHETARKDDLEKWATSSKGANGRSFRLSRTHWKQSNQEGRNASRFWSLPLWQAVDKLLTSGINNAWQLAVALRRQEVPSDVLQKVTQENLSGKPKQKDATVQGWVEKIEAKFKVGGKTQRQRMKCSNIS